MRHTEKAADTTGPHAPDPTRAGSRYADGAVYVALDPSRGRFLELDEEVQDAFRDLLVRFVNLYAFISQIVAYVDRQLERDYLYARALLACLPGQAAERLDLGS